MKMKNKNLEKGITLVALVITIIVLLVLAGVTLNVILNDNLVGKAEIATDSYKSEQSKEKLALSLLSYKLALLSKEPDATIEKFLPEGATASLEGNKYTIAMDGFTFEVDKNTLEILTQDGVSLGGTTGGSSTPDNNREYDRLEKVTIRFRKFLCNTK